MSDDSTLTLQYAGSVKNVLITKENSNALWFAFTDHYSVFDWGKMPDSITNKGCALTLIGAYIFQILKNPNTWQKLPQSPHLHKFDSEYLHKRFNHPVFKTKLQKDGLPSHFLGLFQNMAQNNVSPTLEPLDLNKKVKLANNDLLMKVQAAKVHWPTAKNILHENLYFYPRPAANECRLIPLEVVFRFGMVEGSSLKRKLENNPAYANSLGLKTVPQINKWFAQPTLEFFTKLEPKDRLLSWQEAAILADLSPDQFEELVEIALDIALALHVLFAERNLELWDGKLEFIVNNEQLLLADSVGPDELRLLYNGTHLSKEALRQYYRPSNWAKSLPAAQSLASEQANEDWQEICRTQLKQTPQVLVPEMKSIIDKLYGVITNQLFTYPVFSDHPTLDDLTSSLQNTLSVIPKNK